MNTLLTIITLGTLNYFFDGKEKEPVNRSHYIKEQFSTCKTIKYNENKDNYTILDKWNIDYEDKNKLLEIAHYYFGRKTGKNSSEFDPNTQISELEKTCIKIDSDEDFDLEKDEISKKLKEIHFGERWIDL